MGQLARPSADKTDGAWVKSSGGNIDMYTMIDEVEASDIDYVESDAAPADSPVVFKLSTVEDPVIHTGHVLRVRVQKNADVGSEIDATVQLLEGYVSEQEIGTVIKEESALFEDVAFGFATVEVELTPEEAALITDYSDLYVRIVADQALE